MKTLIRGATVVCPGETLKTDVIFEGSTITAIDPGPATVDVEVDASGLVLIPGVVDDQVHFREPGLTHKEDLEHATRACAAGGVTSFLEMPNTVPNTITQQALEEKLDLASDRCYVNYGFYIGATPSNVDELKSVQRTPGIKIFIGSSTGNLLVDEQDALETIFAETTLPICAHCEDEATVRSNAAKFADETEVRFHSQVRDHQAAIIATKRAIDLAQRHQHRFHVLHVSTADEIELIRNAGELVTAEVCPHHLFFNVDDYATLGSLIKMNPSIKTDRDNVALWQALLDGTIEVVATDHAPHTMEEKQKPYPSCPSGLPAVENSLALMLNQVNLGLCSIDDVVGWMCEAPARIWNLKNKGKIEVGSDADLALVDLNLERQILNERQHTKCGWSPWHEKSLKGWPVKTWVMGNLVYELDGEKPLFSNQKHGREILFDRN